jgi:GNAT superfamily N-acetyltransferase
MASAASDLRQKSWRRGAYLISTDTSLISIPELMSIFDSDDFYWANAPPADVMQAMLQNSLCFGLYDESSSSASDAAPASPRQLVGFARLVTDFVSFTYLTDVWVSRSRRGEGLGRWLATCAQEAIETMPYLRRSTLFTGDWTRSVPFYEATMGMELVRFREGQGLAMMQRDGPGNLKYGGRGIGYTKFVG